MILFWTGRLEVFNYIIHNFLEIEVFRADIDIGDMIEYLLPKYLYREQYSKCKKVLEELFDWTEDKFYHRMSAFHELVLYEFIEYMAGLRDENSKAFDKLYFDERCHLLIEEASKEDFENDDEFSLEDHKKIL